MMIFRVVVDVVPLELREAELSFLLATRCLLESEDPMRWCEGRKKDGKKK
jgi:hypothetical protein